MLFGSQARVVHRHCWGASSRLSMKLRELNDSSLEAYLGQSATPALVTFYAKWSKPARTMMPVLEELAETYEGMVRFAYVDADYAPNALNSYGILNLPTYLVFKRRQESDRFIGLLTKEKLTERIERSLQDVI